MVSSGPFFGFAMFEHFHLTTFTTYVLSDTVEGYEDSAGNKTDYEFHPDVDLHVAHITAKTVQPNIASTKKISYGQKYNYYIRPILLDNRIGMISKQDSPSRKVRPRL